MDGGLGTIWLLWVVGHLVSRPVAAYWNWAPQVDLARFHLNQLSAFVLYGRFWAFNSLMSVCNSCQGFKNIIQAHHQFATAKAIILSSTKMTAAFYPWARLSEARDDLPTWLILSGHVKYLGEYYVFIYI